MSPRQRRRFLRRGRTVLRTMTPVQREIFPWASTTRTAIYSPRAPRTRAMAMAKPAASPLTGQAAVRRAAQHLLRSQGPAQRLPPAPPPRAPARTPIVSPVSGSGFSGETPKPLVQAPLIPVPITPLPRLTMLVISSARGAGHARLRQASPAVRTAA